MWSGCRPSSNTSWHSRRSCQPYGGLRSSTSSLHAKAAQAPICNRLHPENSFGLDLAGLHRMLAVMRRHPKFVFGQDIDKGLEGMVHDASAVVRLRIRTASQSSHAPACSRRYHAACVYYKADEGPQGFMRPLCYLRKCKVFPFADMRVKFASKLTAIFILQVA